MRTPSLDRALRNLRLIKSAWFGPTIWKWQAEPVYRNSPDGPIALYKRRLRPDGRYDYKRLTDDEVADRCAEMAW